MNSVFMCVFIRSSNSTHSPPMGLLHTHMLAWLDLARQPSMAGIFISLHQGYPLEDVCLTDDALQLI